MSFDDKLKGVLERYAFLEQQLANPISDSKNFAKLSKEFSSLEEIVEKIKRYYDLLHQKKASLGLIELDDEDMKSLAEEDLESLKIIINNVLNEIKILLIPKDVDDERNAIIEIRAGAGGEEAGLFAADLLRMYERYADKKGWKFEILSLSETGIGAVKEVSTLIQGKGVFSLMKFESGVHRVQRVPETEAGGRIHTSAATVAVLPEVEDVDIYINDSDLKIDYYRASGAGGQHVNTTDSAVRITHIPTGIVVCQQDERSQHKNKAKAFKILRAHIYEVEKRRAEEERSETRKKQVGSGDRSERIRTYNFPQGRVTDHRINLTLYKIDAIMQGEALDEIIAVLIAEDQALKLSLKQ